MKLTILGASGALGRELTRQAIERGHTVRAVARTPDKIGLPDSDLLTRVAADVYDDSAISSALAGSGTVLMTLGVARGEEPGVLTRGAQAASAAKPAHIVAIGALGSGASAAVAGRATRTLLKLFMGKELPDKIAADSTVLASNGTVFHAGPMSDKPLSSIRRTVGLDVLPRKFFPAGVSRSTVAAAMLDEAENPRFRGATAVPLTE